MNIDAHHVKGPALLAAGRAGKSVLTGFLGLLFLVVLSACNLIGGVSDEEFQAVSEELDTAKADLERTFQRLSSETQNASSLQAEVDDLKAQLEQALAPPTGAPQPISLERARLQVVRFAQQNMEVYGPIYANTALVWEVVSAEEGDEFYYLRLSYRPFGPLQGTPGLEEFITDKTGQIEFRQVLNEPNPEATPAEAEES